MEKNHTDVLKYVLTFNHELYQPHHEKFAGKTLFPFMMTAELLTAKRPTQILVYLLKRYLTVYPSEKNPDFIDSISFLWWYPSGLRISSNNLDTNIQMC